MTDTNTSVARRGREKRRRDRESRRQSTDMVAGSPLAQVFRPLSDGDVARVHDAALTLLETVGMATPTDRVQETALAAGCSLSESGRLLFPRALVEDLLAGAAKSYVVHGRDPAYDFEARNGTVNFCTGGAAVKILDIDTRQYRPSTLRDLYDIARVCNTLENLQWITRPVVITDVEDVFAFDINSIYACAAGTKKHIATSYANGENVTASLPMLDLLAGGDGAFAKRPFCTIHATTVVSPMTFSQDSLDAACAAIDIGMPLHCLTGPQAGATSPAALAGALAQGCAESLASLCIVNMLSPGYPVAMGNWLFVSDLRTGAFSGGGGEQALLCAGAGQMAAFYGIPGGCGSGMTDSKLPDNQAGFEKGLTMATAAMSGGGFVWESAGMLASLLGCSHEALIIDDEMLSVIRRIARGIEVTDETLSVDVVAETVDGPGHYLGAQQTMELMETEYIYPRYADRSSPDDWMDAGSQDMWDRATEHARSVLANHMPVQIDAKTDARIREQFPIMLDPVWLRDTAA
ncbi:MAG: trimethylamine methyltransferase family protein [Rhodospirillales bacterium]|nr:trimethylamine methyltransferase family protein [Rhodospirillales bacterium]